MIEISDTNRAKLRALRLSTFADVYFELLNDEAYEDSLPEDIFFLAVDQALESRRQRQIEKAIAAAGFAYPHASLAEVINPEARGISERQLKRYAATNWREHPNNVHIYAPTGTGKTYLACARRNRSLPRRLQRGLLPTRSARCQASGLFAHR